MALVSVLAIGQFAMPGFGQNKEQSKQRREARPDQSASHNNNPQQKNHPYAGAWLQRYENAPPEQGERALRSEPDFQRLPPDRQQKLVNRLHEFASKPPDERERMVERLQQIEKMPPEQRQELHRANENRKLLDPARKRQVNRAYNFLRELPPQQQEQFISSPAFQQRFSDEERGIINGLLKAPQIEPPLGSSPANPR